MQNPPDVAARPHAAARTPALLAAPVAADSAPPSTPTGAATVSTQAQPNAQHAHAAALTAAHLHAHGYRRHRLGHGLAQAPDPVIGAYAGGAGGYGGHLPLRSTWAPGARDANSDLLPALPMQRAQSRELARTHPIAVGAIRTYVGRVVGTGLALVAQPDRRVLGWTAQQAVDWKLRTQAEFALWADSPAHCDITAAANFYALQAAVAIATAESGDCFTLLPAVVRTSAAPYALRVQLLEADRCGNPANSADTAREVAGVRRNAAGAAEAYHIYRQHPGALVYPIGRAGAADRFAGDWVNATGPNGRRAVLHHWHPTRPGQTRGVPWFAPIVALLKDLDTYTDAELKAAVVSAFLTAFIQTPAPAGPAPIFGGDTPLATIQATGEVEMGPGAVVGLAPGETAQVADPTRPNPAFDGFVAAMMAQVGMALGIPSELLLKRFNASYSASRAALLDAWVFFRAQRDWLANSFCRPVYETWLAEAVALGRVQAPGFFDDPLLRWAYSQAAWHGDSLGSLDPAKEVQAYREAIDAHLLTRERAEWELFGSDWNATLEAKSAERAALDAAGLAPTPPPAVAPPQPAPRQSTDNDDGAEQPGGPSPRSRAPLHPAQSPAADLAASVQAAQSAHAAHADIAAALAALDRTLQALAAAQARPLVLPEGAVQLEAHIHTTPPAAQPANHPPADAR
jgi:lambda family phage portal protein